MRNLKVYILSLSLIVIAIASISARIIYGGQSIQPEFSRNLWHVTIEMSAIGKGKPARVRMMLPQDTSRQTLYNENFDQEIAFHINQYAKTGNRIGYWNTPLLDGTESIRYSVSVQLKGATYKIPQQAMMPKDPYAEYPETVLMWLQPSKDVQSNDESVKRMLKQVLGRNYKQKPTAEIVRRIFDFVRGEVMYRSEKGSKDALATLEKMTADCGGQARLFTALCRASSMPARTVDGIVLEPGVKKISHVWSEVFIDGTWIPFDVTNNHFASIPVDYLEVYYGDSALFRHKGLLMFDYFFIVNKEKIPPLDQTWSLYSLPYRFQGMVKTLLLIPIGTLIVAMFRVVGGLPTLGTFTPVLLSLAFREISIGAGLMCLALIMTVGCFLRALLDHLKILIIPRIAIMVNLVVFLIMSIMVVGYLTNQQKILYVSLFPMVIITWMIERFSIIQIEDGTPEAVQHILGTAIVSIVAYYIMGIPALKMSFFAFPELLLVVVAVLLLVGRYTGVRVTELWRFRELHKEIKK